VLFCVVVCVLWYAYLVHGGCLWPANGHHFLGNADAAAAHANAESVGARVNEIFSLCCSDDYG